MVAKGLTETPLESQDDVQEIIGSFMQLPAIALPKAHTLAVIRDEMHKIHLVRLCLHLAAEAKAAARRGLSEVTVHLSTSGGLHKVPQPIQDLVHCCSVHEVSSHEVLRRIVETMQHEAGYRLMFVWDTRKCSRNCLGQHDWRVGAPCRCYGNSMPTAIMLEW